MLFVQVPRPRKDHKKYCISNILYNQNSIQIIFNFRLDQRSREEEYEKEIENMSKTMQNRKLQIEQIEEVTFLFVKSKYKLVFRKINRSICIFV